MRLIANQSHFLLFMWINLKFIFSMNWVMKSGWKPPAISVNSWNLNVLWISLPWLNFPEIIWFVPFCHLCVLSVFLPFSFRDFVSDLGHCSVPNHVPPTLSVHTTAARVPSPTLVCSTVPPYRYMARMWMLTETNSVSLTWLIFAKCCPFATAKHSFQSAVLPQGSYPAGCKNIKILSHVSLSFGALLCDLRKLHDYIIKWRRTQCQLVNYINSIINVLR